MVKKMPGILSGHQLCFLFTVSADTVCIGFRIGRDTDTSRVSAETGCDFFSHRDIGPYPYRRPQIPVRIGRYETSRPIFESMIPNSKTIVEDWKIGWKVRRGMGEEKHLVTREEIAGIVKRFMDLESDEGKEMRRRAKELKKVCRKAVSKGGTVETAIDAFIHDISQCRDR